MFRHIQKLRLAFRKICPTDPCSFIVYLLNWAWTCGEIPIKFGPHPLHKWGSIFYFDLRGSFKYPGIERKSFQKSSTDPLPWSITSCCAHGKIKYCVCRPRKRKRIILMFIVLPKDGRLSGWLTLKLVHEKALWVSIPMTRRFQGSLLNRIHLHETTD